MPARAHGSETGRRGAREALRDTRLAAAGFAALIVYLSWPLLLHPTGRIEAGGPWGRADLELVAWILSWDAHALATAPLRLFQANIFHPVPDALALSEHLLGLAPVSAPVFWASGNAMLTHNLTIVVVVFVSALTCCVAVRGWTGSALAGFLAGTVFAFAPLNLAAFHRLHTSSVHLFALILYLLWRSVAAPEPVRVRTLVGLAIATALQALAGIYVAFELALLLAAFLPAVAWEARRSRRSLLQPLLAIAVGAAALGIVAPAYLRARASGAVADYSGLAASTFAVRPEIFAALLVESISWPVLVLALIGVWPWMTRARGSSHVPEVAPVSLRLGLVSVAVVGIAVALGPEVPGPYALLAKLVPGFSSMRAPMRFLVLPVLAAACLAGIGAADLLGWAARRARAEDAGAAASSEARAARPTLLLARVLVIAVTAATLALRPLPALHVEPAHVPANDVYAWLAEHGAGRAVLEIPVHNSPLDAARLLDTTGYMVASTRHWLPLVNGYSGHAPPSARLLMTLAQRLPDADALESIRSLADPGWLIVHPSRLLDGGREWRQRASALGLPPPQEIGGALLYELPGHRGEKTARLLGQLADPADANTLDGVARTPLTPEAAHGTVSGNLPDEFLTDTRTWFWVEVENASPVVWPGLSARPEGTLGLAARWRDVATGAVMREDPAVPLARDLGPGEKMRAQAEAWVPPPGEYDLEIGLVQGGTGWLADRRDGSGLVRHRVHVVPAGPRA